MHVKTKFNLSMKMSTIKKAKIKLDVQKNIDKWVAAHKIFQNIILEQKIIISKIIARGQLFLVKNINYMVGIKETLRFLHCT